MGLSTRVRSRYGLARAAHGGIHLSSTVGGAGKMDGIVG